MTKKTVFSQGIPLKKQFGQHFLNNQYFADKMIASVALNNHSSVFEIGCGDGFLTKTILQNSLERLWIFEIDTQWAEYIKNSIQDKRITIYEKNFLDIEGSFLEAHKPWILLSNLPYQITFPILYWLVDNRHLLQEGVVMIQEEVAQKIVKKSGKGYGYNSLFLQHFFDWTLLDKVAPEFFIPPPKVYSRLIHFKPKKSITAIPAEQEFWNFIKLCFRQPRRTLRNNLTQTHINMQKIPEDFLALRAQQMSIHDLLIIWDLVRSC